ncbi:FMN-binding negative transcriptional regulator [Angustibacter aerolatus]
MYTPAAFATSPEQALAFLQAADSGDLVSLGPDGLLATPLPLLHRPGADGGLGHVVMHVARTNAHWRHADGVDGLLIVRGVEGYVSPSWYASKAEHGRVVPTWDYEVAHVRGRLTVHDDVGWLAEAVRGLTERHESRRAEPWAVDDAPARFVEGQLRAIVGLELAVESVELKLKLSQNRPAADVRGVVTGLRADGRHPLADAVAERLDD